MRRSTSKPALGARAIGALLVLATAACRRGASGGGGAVDASSTSAFPVHARDDLGREVVVAAEPRRIVALLPSHTETLFALGVGDRVVGVDDFSDDPPAAARLPKLGGVDVHLEAVVALAPDLVLLSEARTATGALERAGLTAWAGSPRTFDDVFRVVDAIGALVGRKEEAARLDERIRRDVKSVEDAVRERPRVRVYYELDATPYSVGPSSFIGVMLAKAGGEDVVPATLGDFPIVSPELVVAADPAVIFVPSGDDLATRPAFRDLSAVKNARVFTLSKQEQDLIGRPGPRIAEGLRLLVRKLHPEVSP
jgi:iron complex transport system substrate-binding protein